MTLTINKKHLTYTLISVTVVWSLILMQSLHEDIVHQSHDIASNLDNSVSASAKQLSEQLQTIEQISDGVTAQLYTLDHLSEEQKFKSAEVLFNAFPEITGLAIASQRDTGQLDIVYHQHNQKGWRHIPLHTDISLNMWIEAFITSRRVSSWSPMVRLITEDNNKTTRSGYLYASRHDPRNKTGKVILAFVSIKDLGIIRAMPNNLQPELLVLDHNGQPLSVNDPDLNSEGTNSLFTTEAIAGIPEILKEMEAKNLLVSTLALEDVELLITAETIDESGWTLIGMIPSHGAFQFFDTALIIRIGSMLLLTGFVFTVLSLAIRQIACAMGLLNQAITNITSGEFDAQIIVEEKTGVGEMVNHINNMTHKLRERGKYERDTRRASFGHIVQALSSDFFYFTLDNKGVVNYVSPQLAKKWGIPSESLHRHYTDFFTDHPKNNDARRTINNTLNGPSSSVYEIEIHNTLGKKYHIEVVKVPILDYEGKLIGVEGMARNITSRVSNIELFRGLLESAPDAMIITNLNGTITMVNAQAEKLFGYWRYKLENRHVSTLLPLDSQKKFLFLQMSPELRKRFYIRTGMELSILNAMGALIPVEITLSPIETADDTLISISLRDISDRRAAEQALRTSEERFRRMVEALQEEYVFYTRHLDGSYIFMTRSVKHILGYTPIEFTKHKMQYIHHQQDRDKVTQTFERVIKGQRCPSFEIEIVKADGDIAVMEVYEAPAFGRDGNVRAIEGLLRDRTKEKKAATVLALAKDAAEAANDAKTLFLSNMSHELRTPLNGVLGYVQLLLACSEMKPEQQEQLIGIQTCGHHLLTLINDILDLTKAESGNLEVIDNIINLPALLHTVNKILYQKSRQQRLPLRLEIDPDVPPVITGDETKIKQVLVNLMSNALKFTKQGWIELRISLEKRKQQDFLRFAVTDTGIGISEEQMQYIFAPFRQGEGGHHGGTGLGLSISRRIAEALEGTLTVTSKLGGGSCFVFSIPLRRANAEITPNALPSRQTMAEYFHPQQGIEVLIVDDSETDRTVLAELLASAGFLVSTVENGREAANAAKVKAFDLVLMELRMPRMGGYRTSRMIHKFTRNPDIQIIAISAGVYPSSHEHMQRWGFVDFIRKPYRRDELLQVIHHLQLNWQSRGEQPTSPTSETHDCGRVLAPTQIAPLVIQMTEAIELGDIIEVQQLAKIFLNECKIVDSNIEFWITRILACCETLDFEEINKILEQLTVLTRASSDESSQIQNKRM